MPEPDTPDTSGSDRDPMLAELIGNAELAPRGLLARHPDDGLLYLDCDPVLRKASRPQAQGPGPDRQSSSFGPARERPSRSGLELRPLPHQKAQALRS